MQIVIKKGKQKSKWMKRFVEVDLLHCVARLVLVLRESRTFVKTLVKMKNVDPE